MSRPFVVVVWEVEVVESMRGSGRAAPGPTDERRLCAGSAVNPRGVAAPCGLAPPRLVTAVSAVRLGAMLAAGVRKAALEAEEVEQPRTAAATKPGQAPGRWAPPALLLRPREPGRATGAGRELERQAAGRASESAVGDADASDDGLCSLRSDANGETVVFKSLLSCFPWPLRQSRGLQRPGPIRVAGGIEAEHGGRCQLRYMMDLRLQESV